jgi:hypothetical protein
MGAGAQEQRIRMKGKGDPRTEARTGSWDTTHTRTESKNEIEGENNMDRIQGQKALTGFKDRSKDGIPGQKVMMGHEDGKQGWHPRTLSNDEIQGQKTRL